MSDSEYKPYWKDPNYSGGLGDKMWSSNGKCSRCMEEFYSCDSYQKLCPPCYCLHSNLEFNILVSILTYMKAFRNKPIEMKFSHNLMSLGDDVPGWLDVDIKARKK